MKNRRGRREGVGGGREGKGNFRDKRVMFQFRIFRIPEIFSSLMKKFLPPRQRSRSLAFYFSFFLFSNPSIRIHHQSCSILFHHRGGTVCLDTLPNNYTLIIATIIPSTITKRSVVYFVYSRSTKDELCNEELVVQRN